MTLRPAVVLLLVLVTSPGAQSRSDDEGGRFGETCDEEENPCVEDMICRDDNKCFPSSAYRICRPAFTNPSDKFGACIMCHLRGWEGDGCASYTVAFNTKPYSLVEGNYESKVVCKVCLTKEEHLGVDGAFTVIGYDGELDNNDDQRMMTLIPATFNNVTKALNYDIDLDYGSPGKGWGGTGGAESPVQMYSPLTVIVMAAAVAYHNVAC